MPPRYYSRRQQEFLRLHVVTADDREPSCFDGSTVLRWAEERQAGGAGDSFEQQRPQQSKRSSRRWLDPHRSESAASSGADSVLLVPSRAAGPSETWRRPASAQLREGAQDAAAATTEKQQQQQPGAGRKLQTSLSRPASTGSPSRDASFQTGAEMRSGRPGGGAVRRDASSAGHRGHALSSEEPTMSEGGQPRPESAKTEEKEFPGGAATERGKSQQEDVEDVDEEKKMLLMPPVPGGRTDRAESPHVREKALRETGGEVPAATAEETAGGAESCLVRGMRGKERRRASEIRKKARGLKFRKKTRGEARQDDEIGEVPEPPTTPRRPRRTFFNIYRNIKA